MKNRKNRIIAALVAMTMFSAVLVPVTVANAQDNMSSSPYLTVDHVSGSSQEVYGPQLEAPIARNPMQVANVTINPMKTAAQYKEVTKSTIATISQADDAAMSTAQRHVENLAADLHATGSSMGDATLAYAVFDPYKTITVDVLTVANVAPKIGKSDDGYYHMSLDMPNVMVGDSVLVLHCKDDGWVNIRPDYVGANTVSFKTDSMSPFAVVKFSVTDPRPTDIEKFLTTFNPANGWR